MVQRVSVRVVAADQNGDPVAGAEITAKLNRMEVDGSGGYVLPEEVKAVADEDGIAFLELWPNELGSTASQYEFKILNPDTGKTERLQATIPNADCDLHTVANLPAYQGKTDGQLAVDEATAALAPTLAAAAAAQQSATTATTAATAAAGSATTAGTAQGVATQKATEAATSANTAAGKAADATGAAIAAGDFASIANTKAGQAATSAGAAYDSAQAAAGSATAAATSAGQAAGSATSASTSATTATTKAGEAAGSATSAANSATTAGTSAGTATTKAGDAANSATAAATSATTASTKAGEAATSAQTASTAATTATTKAGEAAGSATTATTKAGEAATSAQTATTKAGEASTSAQNAATSAATANTKAQDAAGFALGAEASATTATTKAGEAATSATNAATSAAAAQAAAEQASGGQVQADFAVTDAQSKAFIKNKPDAVLATATQEANLDTLTGNRFFGFGSTATGAPAVEAGAYDAVGIQLSQAGQLTQIVNSEGSLLHRTNDSGTWGAWRKLWDSTNDGLGSGMDADLLDGVQSDEASTASTIVKRTATGAILAKKVQAEGSANYIYIDGGAAGVAPALIANGSDANVGLYYGTRGTGHHTFADGAGKTQFAVGNGGNTAVNYLQARGAVTGSNPGIYPQGSDANVGMDFTCKGSGEVIWRSNGGIQLVIGNTLNPVNYLRTVGAAAGSGPTLEAQGSDANVSIVLRPKGTGAVVLAPGGGYSFVAGQTANAVNYLRSTPAATGSGPTLAADGSDANVQLWLGAKGTGSVVITNGGNAAFAVWGAVAGGNYLVANGSAAGAGPVLRPDGTDANISLNFTPKGTGIIRMNAAVLGSSITLQHGAPQILFDESDQAGAVGLWRAVSDGGSWRLDRNTAAGRDFSTYVTAYDISSAGVMNIASPLTKGGAVVAASQSAAGGTMTVDCSIAVKHTLTATGAVAWAFSNWPTTGEAYRRVDFINFGNFTITPPAVTWTNPDGTETTSLPTHFAALAAVGGRSGFTSNGRTKAIFWCEANGTVYGAFL